LERSPEPRFGLFSLVEKAEVPVKREVPEKRTVDAGQGKKCAEGDSQRPLRLCSFVAAKSKDDQSGQCAGDYREKEDNAHLSCAEPGGNGSSEFDIAQTEALASPHKRVNPTQREQGKSCCGCGDCAPQAEHPRGVPGIRHAAVHLAEEAVAGAVENAQAEQGKCERIGKLHCFRIAYSEGKQQGAEDGEGDGLKGQAGVQEIADRKRGDCGLYKRIAPCDTVLAIAAASAQQKKTEQRDIVANSDWSLAVRAVRGRPHDGFMARQATDADIQKATEGQPDKNSKDNLDGQHRDKRRSSTLKGIRAQYSDTRLHYDKGRASFVGFRQQLSGTVEDMSQQEAGALFQESVAIMARLRGPGGCPWDREQSFATIRQYTLEETYEVLDAIEREHWADLAEELGDLLLQVLFYAQMGEEAGYFSIVDVLEHLNRKLIRRHPHVFGEEASAAAGNLAEVDAASATEARHVLANWEAIKKAEKTQAKGASSGSLLDEVPGSFPALLEAAKLGGKAAKVGFDWPDRDGLLEKVQEECREIEDEVASGARPEAIEGEVGDLLFTVVNLARHLKVDPELALRRTNAKFRRRFAAMEQASDRALNERSAGELEALWEQAKQRETVVAE